MSQPGALPPGAASHLFIIGSGVFPRRLVKFASDRLPAAEESCKTVISYWHETCLFIN
jgi:hypothetical protein